MSTANRINTLRQNLKPLRGITTYEYYPEELIQRCSAFEKERTATIALLDALVEECTKLSEEALSGSCTRLAALSTESEKCRKKTVGVAIATYNLALLNMDMIPLMSKAHSAARENFLSLERKRKDALSTQLSKTIVDKGALHTVLLKDPERFRLEQSAKEAFGRMNSNELRSEAQQAIADAKSTLEKFIDL